MGLSKIIKYIHRNLRYYETIEQIHYMVVKKKAWFGKQIVISDPLLYRRPLLLRQLKNKPESSKYNWSTEFEGI